MTLSFNTFVLMVNQQKIIVTVSNDLSTDQRVKKMCNSLLKMNYEIILLGRIKKDSLPINRPYKVKRFHLWFNKGGLFYANLNIRLFFELLFSNYDRIHANDLDTLLPAFIVSKIRNKPLVYDTHEIFTEVPEIQNRWVKKVWLSIENYLLPKIDHIITVNQSIADFYGNRFSKKIHVIRNIPEKRKLEIPKTRAELTLPENSFIIIAQGSGINVDRGNEELLEAMKSINNALLLFIGSGDAIPGLKKQSKHESLIAKVRFIDRMPYEEMIQYTLNADLGISLDKPSNLNYLYSLPNKIFDYISSNTPILASKLPEVAKVVEGYNVGILIDEVNSDEISAGITKMINTDQSQWDASLSKAAEELTWENEAKALIAFY